MLDKPRFSLAAWLAVEVVIADDPQGDRHRELKQVQAAKVAHRIASGTHKRWQREVPASPQTGRLGKTAVEEMHVYPRSRGRVLWHIGRDLEKAAELLAAHRLGAILAFKRARDQLGVVAERPCPDGVAARRRSK